ncbi:MAG: site-specific integrase [Saccharofermentans sp.]|nr:site-specific integrase [Saccharofermentans sp.]
MNVRMLLNEYVEVYGKSIWTYSTYSANLARIKNYINPLIGDLELAEVTTLRIEKYYRELLEYPRVGSGGGNVNPSVIREIHKLLNKAFQRAVVWQLIDRNPITDAIRPKETPKKRAIWDISDINKANELCKDEMLYLAINLAFTETLREGELLALEWSDLHLEGPHPYLTINKIHQRVDISVLNELKKRDIYRIYPTQKLNAKSVIVAKKPKTDSSIRNIYIPATIVQKLKARREKYLVERLQYKAIYMDYDLVFRNEDGSPMEPSRLRDLFVRFIKENDLPYVCFHSLRHTSITYKLKLTNGNIKAVQGDSGHSQADMITDIYSHILDEDRICNANLIEKEFYQGVIPDKIKVDKSNLETVLSSDEGKLLTQLMLKLSGFL